MRDLEKHVLCRECGGTVQDGFCTDCGEEFFTYWENIIYGLFWMMILGALEGSLIYGLISQYALWAITGTLRR